MRPEPNRLPPKILLVPAGNLAAVNSLVYSDGRKTHCLLVLEKSLPLIEEYDFVINSGGLFEVAAVQTRSAAEIMTDWQVEHGVSREKILQEPDSVDSAESLVKSWEELQRRHLVPKRLDVGGHWFLHGLRFWLIGRAYGIPVKIIGIHYPMPVLDWLRYAARLLYQLTDWGSRRRFARWLRTWRRCRAYKPK